jgi:hypothetical protein
MSVESIKYAPTLTADTCRGPSNAIWKDCPWAALQQEPRLGMSFWDDFGVIGNADMSSAYKNSIGQWSAYGYAGAQINDGQKEGGVIKLSSDGDNEGLTLLSSAGAFRFVTTSTLALNGKMWFECRIAKSVVTSAHLSAFVGLMAPTLSSGLPAAAQPLTTTDDTVMTAGDTFGFNLAGTTSTRGGPTEVGVSFCLASGTINYPTNLTALMAATGNTVLAADTYVKLGWLFDPQAYPKQVSSATARQTAGTIRKPLVRFFVNGLEAPAFLSADDVANATSGQAFPTSFLAPCISVMNMASQSSDYLAVDWIRIAQLANS